MAKCNDLSNKQIYPCFSKTDIKLDILRRCEVFDKPTFPKIAVVGPKEFFDETDFTDVKAPYSGNCELVWIHAPEQVIGKIFEDVIVLPFYDSEIPSIKAILSEIRIGIRDNNALYHKVHYTIINLEAAQNELKRKKWQIQRPYFEV